MNSMLHDREHQKRALLTSARAQELLTQARPGYGQDFTESNWEAIALRLSTLTSLLFQIEARKRHEA